MGRTPDPCAKLSSTLFFVMLSGVKRSRSIFQKPLRKRSEILTSEHSMNAPPQDDTLLEKNRGVSVYDPPVDLDIL